MDRGYVELIKGVAKGLGLVDSFVRYNPIFYKRALRAIAKFESASATQKRHIQAEYTELVLSRASRTRYGRRYGTDLCAWPILQKSTLKACPSDFLVRGLVRVPASTGGTTGIPLRLYWSLSCIAADQAFIDTLLMPYGFRLGSSRVAVLRADYVKDLRDTKPPYGRMRGGSRLILSNAHLSSSTVSWFVQALREFEPEVFWVYPGMAANLLYLMERAGLQLRIPLVLCSSESMSPELSKALSSFFGAKVIDYYGQGERVCFSAGSCEEGYKFYPAYGNVELLRDGDSDDNDRLERVRIIATGYWNSAMPLVRYDTGDRAIVPKGLCDEDLRAIELGDRTFLGIAGRSNEYVVARGGRRISGLNHFPKELDSVLQIQVVQHSLQDIVIRVLPRGNFEKTDRARLMQNARELIPPDIDVRLDVVDRLYAGPNGKVPFVIRRVGE